MASSRSSGCSISSKVFPCDSDLVVDVRGIGDDVGHEQSPL
jgi:hypothetical protein